ncbi:MAG: type II toxin-antitoxin system VapC family toxin [Candidatus Bathyarchaeia archaeon]
MIVIDASTLASFIMMEPGYEKVATYIKNSMSVDHIVKEVGNVIWKAYIRNYVTEEEALKRFLNLLKLTRYVIKLVDEMDLIEEASEMAIKDKISLYDSLYIALALEEDAKMLTLDAAQAQTAERYGVEAIKV